MSPEWIDSWVATLLHDWSLDRFGGAPGVRDAGLLESALARPQQKLGHGEPQPDLCDLAAAYAFGIARNHPFIDGNKRTGWAVAITFLATNGLELVEPDQSVSVITMIGLAEGLLTEEEFATWLRRRCQ